MARILNLEAYPLAETISDNSYLVGTDVTDNKETKNFKIEDLKTHILPDPLTPGTFVNATVIVDADGQISSVATGSSSGISISINGTSGPASLTNNILNIPVYSPTLQQVMGEGSTATVTTPINITLNNVTYDHQIDFSANNLLMETTDGTEISHFKHVGSTIGEMKTVNGTGGEARVRTNSDGKVGIKALSGSGDNEIKVNPTTIEIVSSLSRGMKYDGNYSINGISTYGNRWIPDVGWVNTQIAAIPSGVTSVNTTDSFVTITDPTTTPSISIGEASGTATGVLTSTDWNTFNNKTAFAEPAIFSGSGSPTLASGVTDLEIRTLIGAGVGDGVVTSITTSGTSGAAQLNAGVLNIPNYANSGGTVTGITSNTLNQLTVTNGSSSAELDILTATVAVGETALATGDQIASYVSSEISSIGAVTATSGSNNQVAVFDGTDSIEGDSNFTWNGSTLEVSNGTEYSRVHPDYFYNLSESDDANLYLYTKSNGTSVGSEIIFGRWNGTVGSESPLVNSQLISAQRIMGAYDVADPTNLSTGALIEVRAAENWSTTAQGVRYTIDTNATGEITPTERFAIDSDGNTKITGNVGIGTTPISGKALAVDGSSVISGQLDLNGSGDSKLKLINSTAQDTSGNNYMTWYQSNGSDRRGYLGFTDPNTFNINVQDSPDISQIILDADEIILNSSDETQSGTIKSGVWEATPIADAYIAEDYVTASTGANNRIAVFDGTDSIDGDANFTWSTTTLTVGNSINDNTSNISSTYLQSKVETNDANCLLYGYGTGNSGELVLSSARGTIDSSTAVQSGDTLGEIQGSGHSGTGFRLGGRILFLAGENYVENSNYGTKFGIQTVTNGSTSLATRYIIDGDGDHTFTGNVEVQGSGEILKLESSAATGNGIMSFYDAGGEQATIGFDSGSDALVITNKNAYNATTGGGEIIFKNDAGSGSGTYFDVLKIEGNGDVHITADLIVNGAVVTNGTSYSPPQTFTPTGTSQAINWSNGNVVILDLGSATGDVTLTMTSVKAGASCFIQIIQGSVSRNVVFPSAVKFAGETAPYTLAVTPTNNAIDVVALTCVSSNPDPEIYLANVSQNYG